MSQMPGTPVSPTSVSPFSRPPQNPYSARVSAALASQQSPDPTPAPQPVSTPAAAPSPQPALVPPPVARRTPIYPAPQPDPQPDLQPTPQPEPQPIPQPVYPPVGNPTVDYETQRLISEAQQLRSERDALAQQLAQNQKELDDYHLLKQQAEIQQGISKDVFSGLQSVDPEDAEIISRTAANAAAKSMAMMRKEMEDQRKYMDTAAQQQAESQRRYQIQQMNREILAAHPDFYELQNQPEYKAFLNQRDGMSFKTRDQRAAEEFLAGNTAYVINMLNEYKGSRPTPQQVASVAPVQFATAPAAPVEPQSQAAPKYTLAELNTLYQMRRISHDQYREELNKLRAANSY